MNTDDEGDFVVEIEAKIVKCWFTQRLHNIER